MRPPSVPPSLPPRGDLTAEECRDLWTVALSTGQRNYIRAAISLAQRDAARDEPCGRRWMHGVQLLRDSGALDEDGAAFLLMMVIGGFMSRYIETDPELLAHKREYLAMDGVCDPVTGEPVAFKDAPEDTDGIGARWERRFEALRASMLGSVGENDLARMLLLFPDEFEERIKKGRRTLLGAE